MRTVNKVILIWNVTKDPYIKTTTGDKKIALFTVATNRHYRDVAWMDQSEAEYTNCVAWGPLAERSEQFLVKGKLVYIEGRLKTRVIDREDGTKLHKTEVVVANLIFLSKREDFPEGEDDSMDDSILDEIHDIADDRF